MPFTALDAIVAVVILISALLAMIRGFTREFFSIASWAAAAAAAYFFWQPVLPYVERYVHHDKVALAITVAGIFFITLIIVSVITMRISDFVLDSRAGPLDRTLGFLFGAARGLLLVVIAVAFLNGLIEKDRQPPWIANAQSLPWLSELGDDLKNRLPPDLEDTVVTWLRQATGREDEQQPGSEQVIQEPSPDSPAGGGPQPGIATDDQNQLQRQIDAPPPE